MDDKHQELLDRLAALKEAAQARPNDLTIQAGIEILERLLDERCKLQEQSQQGRERRQQLQLSLTECRNRQAIQCRELEILKRDAHEELLLKQQILAQRNRLQSQLQAIESTVQEAVVLVKEAKTLREKFSILWDFIQVIFSNEELMAASHRNTSLIIP